MLFRKKDTHTVTTGVMQALNIAENREDEKRRREAGYHEKHLLNIGWWDAWGDMVEHQRKASQEEK